LFSLSDKLTEKVKGVPGMLLSPTMVAHRLRRIQAALLALPSVVLPMPWCAAVWLLLTATAVYAHAWLRTRRLMLSPQGLCLSGGLFVQETLHIPTGAWTGLRILPLPFVREVFLLLPHRTVYLFPMTRAQLARLRAYLENIHES
jgi:hypothetical protein